MLAGDVRAVARAISLIEDGAPEAAPLLSALFPHAGRALVVGVTGPPGAGKSTLVDRNGRSSGPRSIPRTRPLNTTSMVFVAHPPSRTSVVIRNASITELQFRSQNFDWQPDQLSLVTFNLTSHLPPELDTHR